MTLHRCFPQEELGLKLCFDMGSSLENEVYVSQVTSESVADKDASIFSGDRILQVIF